MLGTNALVSIESKNSFNEVLLAIKLKALTQNHQESTQASLFTDVEVSQCKQHCMFLNSDAPN